MVKNPSAISVLRKKGKPHFFFFLAQLLCSSAYHTRLWKERLSSKLARRFSLIFAKYPVSRQWSVKYIHPYHGTTALDKLDPEHFLRPICIARPIGWAKQHPCRKSMCLRDLFFLSHEVKWPVCCPSRPSTPVITVCLLWLAAASPAPSAARQPKPLNLHHTTPPDKPCQFCPPLLRWCLLVAAS